MSALLEHAEQLPRAIAIVIAAAAFTAYARARGRGRLRRLLGGETPRDRTGSLLDAALVMALALVAVGLLGPRLGRSELASTRGGADVVLLFDLSRSMDAADPAPSRLARATASARALLAGLDDGDRVALAGFAGRGVLFTPLTPDRDAIASLLPALASDVIRPRGSALGAGLEAAAGAFEGPLERPRVVVLFSDGEASDAERGLAASALGRAEARVVAIAFGSDRGAALGPPTSPLRDERGEIVVSRRQLVSLERLAERTDGVVFATGPFGELDLDGLVRAVDRDAAAAADTEGPRRTVAVVLAWPFAALAFALLVGEALAAARTGAGHRTQKTLDARPAAVSWLALIAAAALVLTGARGAQDDPHGGASLQAAVDLAEHGEVERAEALLRAVAVLDADPTRAALAEYDLGVLALAQGELERARDHFFAALVHDPRDRRTRWNAEWTLRALAERRAAEPEPPPADTTRRGVDDGAGEPAQDEPSRAQEREESGRAADGADAGEPSAAHTDAPADGGAEPPVRLDEGERARWRGRVKDQPSRALGLLAQDGGRDVVPAHGGITW